MTPSPERVRLEEIGATSWREALDVKVEGEQLRFVADHQPFASLSAG